MVAREIQATIGRFDVLHFNTIVLHTYHTSVGEHEVEVHIVAVVRNFQLHVSRTVCVLSAVILAAVSADGRFPYGGAEGRGGADVEEINRVIASPCERVDGIA